jgi:hypothetical protein
MDGDVQRGEGGNKQWKDEKYHMRVAKEFPSCVRNPPALASTYGRFVRTQGWKDKRTVISLCERLSRSYGNWGTVSKFEDRLFDKILKDPQGKDQNVPSWLDNPCTSRTILHEAFHSNLIEPHSTYLPTASDLVSGRLKRALPRRPKLTVYREGHQNSRWEESIWVGSCQRTHCSRTA